MAQALYVAERDSVVGTTADGAASLAAERERCAQVCDAEARRARELMTVTEADGRPLYDAHQLDAGACALEHAAALIRGRAISPISQQDPRPSD
jgi:hypothetical protein